MRILQFLAVLLAASPAFGQSRLYTNADLGQPLSPERVTVSPAQLRALAAHQFRLPPEAPDGPTFAVVDTSRPFARSTDELIATAPAYLSDMYLGNRAAIWASHRGGYRSVSSGRSWTARQRPVSAAPRRTEGPPRRPR